MNVWEPQTKTFPRAGWWGLYLIVAATILEGLTDVVSWFM